jgi:hypothetical protein
MARPNPKTHTHKYERILSISTSSHSPYVRDSGHPEYHPSDNKGIHRIVPYIRLKGLWLERAGFCRNYQIRVEVSRGKLVITKR